MAGEVYYDPSYSLIQMIVIVAFIGLFFVWLNSMLKGSKSHQYRHLLVDMYVVGMIRKYAVKDGINLNDEMKDFVRMIKKSNISEKGVDSVIEDELNEKIIKDSEANLEKK